MDEKNENVDIWDQMQAEPCSFDLFDEYMKVGTVGSSGLESLETEKDQIFTMAGLEECGENVADDIISRLLSINLENKMIIESILSKSGYKTVKWLGLGTVEAYDSFTSTVGPKKIIISGLKR